MLIGADTVLGRPEEMLMMSVGNCGDLESLLQTLKLVSF